MHGATRSVRAVLLVHGFGDTPQTLAALAADLHAHGYDVRVPLLPGHGRTLAAFDASTHEEWIACVASELLALRADYPWVGLAGLSMGGALSAIVAATMRDLPALVLMAPYLGMPRIMRMAARTARLWSRWVGPIASESPESIHDVQEREKNLSYGAVTGHALHELSVVVRMAQRALPRIIAPTLLVQSRHDNRIPLRVAEHAYARLGTSRKQLMITELGGHILTVDVGRAAVFAAVRAWLEGGPGTIPSTPDTVGARTAAAPTAGTSRSA